MLTRNRKDRPPPKPPSTSPKRPPIAYYDVDEESGRKRPRGLKWRSSPWFITAVVTMGVISDLCCYSIVVPVLPFRLESLGFSSTNISSLTSYLLISYSVGLVVSTPPVAWLSGIYNSKRVPLLLGLILLIGAQIMFMLVKPFALMCVARGLQGIASTLVWVVGLALICDTVPEESVGVYLGFALSGTSIGLAIGPPLGGVLYQRLGWHAPIVFAISIAGVDLFGRLLIIERHHANRWVIKPASASLPVGVVVGSPENEVEVVGQLALDQVGDEKEVVDPPIKEQSTVPSPRSNVETKLNVYQLLKALLGTPRGLTAYGLTFLYGLIYASQEPTLTLRLADVWGKDALQVGLIYIGIVIPSFVAGPIAGWLSDKYGPSLLVPPLLVFAIPWYLLQIPSHSLPGFIISLMLSALSIAMIVSPVSADLAAVALATPGVEFTHVYGSFNIAFSVASALGPLMGGQIYDHVAKGWIVLCIIWSAMFLAALPFACAFVGDRPLLSVFIQNRRRRRRDVAEGELENGEQEGDTEIRGSDQGVDVSGEARTENRHPKREEIMRSVDSARESLSADDEGKGAHTESLDRGDRRSNPEVAGGLGDSTARDVEGEALQCEERVETDFITLGPKLVTS